MSTDFGGDFRQIAGERLHDAQRGRGVARKPLRHRDPGRHVHRVKEPQREFRIVPFFGDGVGDALHVKIGEYTQQCRPHIQAATRAERSQGFQAENVAGFHVRDSNTPAD